MRSFFLLLSVLVCQSAWAQQRPNVILIYADDLGYGDLGCYGATKIKTPAVDKLAAEGLRFTNAHTTSATCTPSRYALLTGEYPWRKSGTGVLPGDASLIIPTDRTTLASLFRQQGYATGIVGKWHLGLGSEVSKDWNKPISPGPRETGFQYSFIFPATADRVPTVFLENQEVVGADPADSISVSYKQPIGNEPTGKEYPELLKMKASKDHGHDQTIINGIGRIGYMSGGQRARWTDEEMPLTFLAKAKQFIRDNKGKPFFLFYSLTEPHVPRMPSTMFKGKSGLGYRGDAILQLDWTVGEIMTLLAETGLDKNTIIIFSSDNGPVLDDGYIDGAVTELDGHTPAGLLRGGKYSIFEAGTRVPFIVRWPGRISKGTTEALFSQVDMFPSFAAMLGATASLPPGLDGRDQWRALTGKDIVGRDHLIEQGQGTLGIRKGNWKYIEPSNGPAFNKLTSIELGNHPEPQLYDLSKDPGETKNLAKERPEVVRTLSQLLKEEKKGGR